MRVKDLNEKKIIRNILQWAKISEKNEWYLDANFWCLANAIHYNLKDFQVAGIVSAFSPMKNWEENKRMAENFIKSGKTTGAYSQNIDKAKAILHSQNPENVAAILNGQKQQRFFWNIYVPLQITGVTIDRHALACCFQSPSNAFALGEATSKMTSKQYQFFEQCYLKVAKKLNILPQDLQSMIWVKYREIREISYNIVEPF
jgi:hypothetical protein